MDICPFEDVLGPKCPGFVSEDDVNCIVLSQPRGIENINRWNVTWGTDVSVAIGSIVHKKCRSAFTKEKSKLNIRKIKTEEEEHPVKYLRSNNSQDFDYATHCLFCENLVVDEKGLRHTEVFRVSTWNFQNKIILICGQRGDKWAKDVFSRIQFAIDLPAKDALYHRLCSNNFRTKRGIPIKFRKSSDNSEQKQVGRPVDQEKTAAFEIVMDEFENTDETITINELIKRMRSICDDPYSPSALMDKLKNLENIVITRSNNGANLITSKVSISNVLKNFHLRKDLISGTNENEWKKEIVYTAARLMIAEMDEMEEERDYYPNSDIGDSKKQVNYVPFLLRTFLREIFAKRKTDMDTRVAAIGQAIIQQHRPRSIIAPMQFGLTMKAYDECPGLINDLFKSGFCLSNDEANLFKVCAASYSPDPFSLTRGTFGHIIGDNFDHNKNTLTGHGTIHDMGLMYVKNPSSDPDQRIKRDPKKTAKQNLKELSRIEIKHIKRKSNMKSSK